MERKMMVRVTRHPLTNREIEKHRAEGILPEDWRSRSVEAHDFVEVVAGNDLDARAKALARTSLAFKGEQAQCHEVLASGALRELTV